MSHTQNSRKQTSGDVPPSKPHRACEWVITQANKSDGPICQQSAHGLVTKYVFNIRVYPIQPLCVSVESLKFEPALKKGNNHSWDAVIVMRQILISTFTFLINNISKLSSSQRIKFKPLPLFMEGDYSEREIKSIANRQNNMYSRTHYSYVYTKIIAIF